MGVAQSRAEDPLAGLLTCRVVAGSAARLACFDRESAIAATASAGPSAGSGSTTLSAPAAVSPPALGPQQRFGLAEHAIVAKEVASGIRPADTPRIQSVIVNLKEQPDGLTVFTLDNGQVWRQLLADGDMLAKQGDMATISRGMLSSYWLQLKSGRGCKVTRLR